ncbi:MAG: type II secretion system protein N [Burkholderiales bacterium]
MQQISVDRMNFAQTAVITLVTIGALALLGFVAAYWTWAWLAPRPEPRAQTAAESASGAPAGALFGSVQQGGQGEPGETIGPAPSGIVIRLHGIVAASRGKDGFAVVELGPSLILAVREGEEIAPGLRLVEVGTDHVILERDGSREPLALPQKHVSTEPAASRENP